MSSVHIETCFSLSVGFFPWGQGVGRFRLLTMSLTFACSASYLRYLACSEHEYSRTLLCYAMLCVLIEAVEISEQEKM